MGQDLRFSTKAAVAAGARQYSIEIPVWDSQEGGDVVYEEVPRLDVAGWEAWTDGTVALVRDKPATRAWLTSHDIGWEVT